MGLLSGSVACTRFNVVTLPDQLAFDLVPFRPVTPRSNIREREGFVPFEPDGSYELGVRRWAFRVRIDRVVLDSTALTERLKELVKQETEAVGPPSPKTRQRLKLQAEEEMMEHPMPRTNVIECVLEETTLYVGSTAKGHLGLVLELLRRIGVEVDYKTPWLDTGQEEDPSDLVDMKEPGQSLWGCRFLKALLDDAETFVEPEKGSVKLVTGDGAKVSLSGPVLTDLERFLESGASVTAAKLMVDGFQFGFDGLSYRITGLVLENQKSKHWTEGLETRLDKLKSLWEWLDTKYQLLLGEQDQA